jgi:REP-associated tyrosine transposase
MGMPRKPRQRSVDHLYHLTSRGVVRRPIFSSHDDLGVFLATIGGVVSARGWRCHAYCLMPNHYHLLVDTPRADLPEGMRDLNSSYATRFNAAHAATGHVFQGRYDARIVRSHAHALEVIRYIPLNPVRAALCQDPADWPWSSYRASAGLAAPAKWLTTATTLAWFGDGEIGRRRYREFVGAGRAIVDPELAALRELVGDGRIEALRRVRDEYGYSVRAIAKALGVHHSTLAERLKRDPTKGV